MKRELHKFLNVDVPSKGYHAHNGEVEIFNEKDLSFICGCNLEHKVKDALAIIDFAFINKAIYVCPKNQNQFNLVKAKGLFKIKSLKTIAAYCTEDENERMVVISTLERRKNLNKNVW